DSPATSSPLSFLWRRRGGGRRREVVSQSTVPAAMEIRRRLHRLGSHDAW
ncbi:Os02g0190950, partial [Oryza sativa Japonica Group]